MILKNENGHTRKAKFLTKKFDFRGHIPTFQAKNKSKSVAFEAENNTSEQHQNNFQKEHKTGFFTLKIVKMTLSEGQNLN